MNSPFYGKYRGVVTNINDPAGLGRIKATVKFPMGDRESGWAEPSVPFGGNGMGFFALPKMNAGVWIEFEQGDTEHPIWSGCWFGSKAEMPPVLLTEPPDSPFKKVLLKTEGGHSILLDDTPGEGGITLETSDGQKVVISATGIEIDNGQGASIKLTGRKVSVNGDALEVT